MDLPLLAAAGLLLAGGAAYAAGTAPAAHEVNALDGRITVSLPAGWAGDEHDGVFEARPPSLDGVPPTLSVAPVTPAEAAPPAREAGEYLMGEAPAEPAGGAALDVEIARMEERRQRSGVGYRVLRTEEREAFGGHPSAFTHYAIVRDPPGTAPGSAHLPEVVVGVDVLVQTPDGLVQISASGPPDAMRGEGSEISDMLDSMRIR